MIDMDNNCSVSSRLSIPLMNKGKNSKPQKQIDIMTSLHPAPGFDSNVSGGAERFYYTMESKEDSTPTTTAHEYESFDNASENKSSEMTDKLFENPSKKVLGRSFDFGSNSFMHRSSSRPYPSEAITKDFYGPTRGRLETLHSINSKSTTAKENERLKAESRYDNSDILSREDDIEKRVGAWGGRLGNSPARRERMYDEPVSDDKPLYEVPTSIACGAFADIAEKFFGFPLFACSNSITHQLKAGSSRREHRSYDSSPERKPRERHSSLEKKQNVYPPSRKLSVLKSAHNRDNSLVNLVLKDPVINIVPSHHRTISELTDDYY